MTRTTRCDHCEAEAPAVRRTVCDVCGELVGYLCMECAEIVDESAVQVLKDEATGRAFYRRESEPHVCEISAAIAAAERLRGDRGF